MLKCVAALIMLLDHLTSVFVPQSNPLYPLGRMLGRLAMPIFAYYIAIGFIHTRSFKYYLKRIALMALFAQIPFVWMNFGYTFDNLLTPGFLHNLLTHLNIGVTFICALMALNLFEKVKASEGFSKVIYSLAIVPWLFLSTFADYSFYGVGLVFLFYFLIKGTLDSTKFVILMLLMTFLTMGPSSMLLQGPAVFSLLLIKYVPQDGIRLPKHFFYVFYPLHQLILALLNSLF